MKKFARILLFVLLSLLLVVAAVLPRVVTGVVERMVADKLDELGFPCLTSMSMDYCWRNGPGVSGELVIVSSESAWQVVAEYAASACEWWVKVTLPETRFSESDPVLGRLLESYPQPAISNVAVSGSIALEAVVERTFSMPVPVWSVKVPLRDVSASVIKENRPLAMEGMSVTLGVSGIADHYDIAPAFLRAKSFSAAEFVFTNCFAALRATEKALLITEAGADFGGGRLGLYSVFVNPASLNMGFTLFLDEIDAGAALSHLRGFHGEASGKLHGKVRLFVQEGGRLLRLSDAFLYSTPGEVGKLRMSDPKALTDNLEMMGVDSASRDNVARAMADLDYSVLRFDLRRKAESMATLSMHVKGTATRGEVTVPVDVIVNVNGELEQLLNRGMSIKNTLKEKKP